MFKKLSLFVILIVFLSGCSNDELHESYEQASQILASNESGFSSTIVIGEDSYFLEQDILGNKHIIENTTENKIEMYYIDEMYYICNEVECVSLNKENLEEMYQDKYSLSILQKVIDSAYDYHKKEYEYILSTENDNVEYSLAIDENDVYTVKYPTTKKGERQVLIVDSNKGEIIYDYNVKEEEKVTFKLKPDLIIKLRTEDSDE